METRDSTILEPSGEDSMLIETVKNMVTREEGNELEDEEEYFLVSGVQDVEYSVENTVEETVDQIEDKVQLEETITWTNLCRICANVSDQSIPIFEKEGLEHDLSTKIFKYLPIHVSETDTLPLQLCYHCAATLIAWHELSERCLNAERKLLDMQEILQSKNQYFNSTSLDNLEMPAPIVTTTTATTIIASSTSDQQIANKSKIRNTEEIDKSNRSCSVRTPFRVFLDTQNIFWKPYRKRCQPTHQRKPYATEDSDSVRIAVIETILDPPPAIFEQVHNNDPLRLPTEVKEEPIVIKQSISDSEEENKSCETAVIHSEKSKVLDSYRKCSNSNRGSKNINKLKKLSKGVNDQGSFQCIECGKCFKLKDSYLRHMRIHKNERPFTCHICGKQFRDSGGLSRHLNDVHAKLKNFTCDLCGKSFASKATRDDHRRTHTGERPYICDSCGKTFKSKASLYIHSKLHTDEFPHLCSYCGKQFRRRQEMLAHVTTHTGEKNHTCDVCAKKFRVKSELARHKLIHSDSKPFVCVKCGLAFRQKRYLNNHIKSRHTESLRAC